MKISCIIPTKNRLYTLKNAINSVLNGSISVYEIIIIDDGGNDESEKVCNILKMQNKTKTKIIYKKIKSSGVSKARNIGINLSVCEWICFLDSDDIWHKDKIKKHIALHKNNPNLLISQTREVWVKNNCKFLPSGKFSKKGGYIFELCIKICCVSVSCVMVNKNIFYDIGYFDESFLVCEDYDLWLRISKKYEIGLIDSYEVTRFDGDDQLSKKYNCMDEYRVKALLKHIQNKGNDNKKYLKEYSKNWQNYQVLIKKEIIKKCNILIQGAIKRNKRNMASKYKNIIIKIKKT
jgi:glycosyltransferase involved in cell wall biosynthesis